MSQTSANIFWLLKRLSRVLLTLLSGFKKGAHTYNECWWHHFDLSLKLSCWLHGHLIWFFVKCWNVIRIWNCWKFLFQVNLQSFSCYGIPSLPPVRTRLSSCYVQTTWRRDTLSTLWYSDTHATFSLQIFAADTRALCKSEIKMSGSFYGELKLRLSKGWMNILMLMISICRSSKNISTAYVTWKKAHLNVLLSKRFMYFYVQKDER